MDNSLDEAFETRKELEGPAAVRWIGAAAGAALALSAIFSLVTGLKKVLLHPASFVLEVYECLFGAAIVILEIKDLEATEGIRDFFYKWFPFLTFVGGKAVFYIFTGSLGSGYWGQWIRFIPAMLVLAIGVIYMLIHFGKFSENREKMNDTYAFTRSQIIL